MRRSRSRLVLPVLLLTLSACSAGEGTGDAGSRASTPSAAPPSSTAPDAPAGPGSVSPSPASSPSPSPSPTPIEGPPDAARAVRLATLLADDVGPRPAGGRADAVSRLLVASWLRDAGWEVDEQAVPLPQGGATANLVARWDGRGDGEPHVVLGAHLDTVAGSPGGNDNASGVGALVALAAELADEAAGLPVPVVLVAFGAEEYQPSSPRQHHIGSEHYADQAGDDVVAMLSLDMLAFGPTTCICWYDAGPPTLAQRLAALAGDGGFRVEHRGDISDHGPFARRGVPAAFLWTYREPRWHSPDDTADHLQVDAVRRAADLAAALVRGLGPGDRDGLAGP